MSTCEILNEINKLKVVDWDCDDSEIVYINVEDTDANREVLMKLGASKKEIDDIAEDGMIDISRFAFEKCGADWYQYGVGFGKNETPDAVINYSVAVLAEIIEHAKQENKPIYEENEEVDQWVRLSDVEDAINKYLN